MTLLRAWVWRVRQRLRRRRQDRQIAAIRARLDRLQTNQQAMLAVVERLRVKLNF